MMPTKTPIHQIWACTNSSASMIACFAARSADRAAQVRRAVRQVILSDFLSMYPTVCTLMGLWRYIIAEGIAWRDVTVEIRHLLETITFGELQSPAPWSQLQTLVRVLPRGEIFPGRAVYPVAGLALKDQQTTIGSNHLTCDQPLWLTLADCIAAKLLTCHAPEVVEAIASRRQKCRTGLLQLISMVTTPIGSIPRRTISSSG